ARVHVRARSVLPTDLVDRRGREYERGGPPPPPVPRGGRTPLWRPPHLPPLAPEGPEAAGYDLRPLMVGSEGTLGVVAAVCVRLTPLPPAVRTMLFDFATVEDCAATVSGIIASGVVPAAVEMMDRGIVVAAERFAHAGY